MKPNQWLSDKEQVAKEFPLVKDSYYLQELCAHIAAYLRRCPTKVLCLPNGKASKLIFRVKTEAASFDIDPDIAYHDFICKIEQEWLVRFFPQYSIQEEKLEPCTDQEMAVLLEEHAVDELLATQELGYKRTPVRKYGIITKIALMDDRFKLETNEGVFWRLSTIPLSHLLDTLRTLTDPYEKKAFIEAKSTLMNKVGNVTNKTYVLSHTPKQLLNFFKIRRHQLAHCPLKYNSETNHYEWGSFRFRFDSPQLEAECRQLLEPTTQPSIIGIGA